MKSMLIHSNYSVPNYVIYTEFGNNLDM